MIHESSYVDSDAKIGEGTDVWHFCHITGEARIGENCTIGQNVYIAGIIGDNCKIQNNVSVYAGVILEDSVFCGPSCVFTNVLNPRTGVRQPYQQTLVRKGAVIGANATIVCGITIGQHATVGAGAVVTKDVPDYALVIGIPAKQRVQAGEEA